MYAAAIASAASTGGNILAKYGKWLVLAAAAFLAYRFVWPMLRVALGLVPEDAQMQQGGGDVRAGFYAERRNKASALHNALTSNALTSNGRCNQIFTVLGWNSNETRIVHNAYKNRYGSTIYADLDEIQTDDCGWFGMDDGNVDTLRARLESLGLTS